MTAEASAATATPAAALANQASEQLQALVRQLQAAQEQQTAAARERLARIMVGLQPSIAHTFGVFSVSGAQRFMVLRDVAEVNGTKPVHTTSEFADALRWVNGRLVDVVRAPAPAASLDALAAEVDAVARQLEARSGHE